MNVLITGANRGIGLDFVKHYLADGAHVWACHRRDKTALEAIKSDQLTLVQWDVTDTQVDLTQLPPSLDLLINNAGIYGPSKQSGQALNNIQSEDMMKVLHVDCAGPLLTVQALRPALTVAKGCIANISSKMGLSTDNSSGSCYAYRAAKAALIITSKSMAIDLASDGIQVITIHPGWVKTDMTHHNGEIDSATSVNGMCKVIKNIANYLPGEFIAYDGEAIPY